MRIVFFGTPDFAVPVLNALASSHDVTAAVTQPDRPKGRGQGVALPPVKQAALELGIPVLQPETLRRSAEIRGKLAAFEADAFVVAACGLILPGRVLEIPKYGCINVHASLLPKYRGAAPIQYALLNGDAETGVTIMRMDRGIDTGDIIIQKSLPVLDGERFPSLHDRVSAAGAALVTEALALIETGAASYTPQDGGAATYAPVIAKADGRIDWNNPAGRVVNQLRALTPWPGVFTFYNKQVIKVWACEPSPDCGGTAAPGAVLRTDGQKGILVKTGDNALWLTELQAEGGRRMSAADYLRGHSISAGAAFE